MTSGLDLIALGETMLSLVAITGTLADASTFRATHGGAESNACVAAVRLGLRSAWVSRLGDDEAGDRVLEALQSSGVDVRWVRRDPERSTGLMLRDTSGSVRYWRAGSAASVMEPDALDGVPVADARAALVTGITAMIGPGPLRTATAFLDRAAEGLRAVDPNLRPGLWGSDRALELIGPLIARCDVLLAGERELGSLLGARGETLARRAAELGPREVVLKRGADGAAALAPDGTWRERRPVPVIDVDPVGAGDAFNAAYIAARLQGGDVDDGLDAGTSAGAEAARVFGDTA